MSFKRLIPERPFPEYIFIPGKNPHPKKLGGHMEGEEDPIALVINLSHPNENDFFRYAIDLFNFGYFWESHVYFEALWNAHQRTGDVADLMKAMIKLGAAGVKILIGENLRAEEHRDRARELFEIVRAHQGDQYLGINILDLIQQIDSKVDIKIIPQWK